MAALIDILDELTVEGTLYETLEDGAVRCYACGHRCLIREGRRGICKVRFNKGGKLYVPWGYAAALQADPIEKKPFFHFLPGSDALTFGMLGCDFHCGYCFTGETTVITNHGPVSFEGLYQIGIKFQENPNGSISYPEELLAVTRSGSYHRVKAVFKHPYMGKLLHIKPYYLPGFHCTPDHRIYATADITQEPQLICAEELTLSHSIVIPKIPATGTNKLIDVEEKLSEIMIEHLIPWKLPLEKREAIIEATKNGKTSFEIGRELDLDPSYVRHVRSKVRRNKNVDSHVDRIKSDNGWVRFPKEHRPGIPCHIDLNNDFARLLGYYCSEGSVIESKNRPNSSVLCFSFSHKEDDLINEMIGLIERVFKAHARLIPRKTTKSVALTNASASRLMMSIAGKGARGRFIPDELFHSPLPVIQNFLDAYIQGDGHIFENGKITCTTVSKQLAYGVAWLVLKTGKMPSIYETKMSEVGQIQGRTVNRAPVQYSIVWYQENKISRKLVENERYFLIPIKELTTEDYTGDVYNMEVEEEHNYLAGFFLVSNCQNWITSQAGRDEMSDLAISSIHKVTPEQMVGLAKRAKAGVVVSSYNEPLITSEWAVEIFKQARAAGFACAYVSNGNMTREALEYIRPYIAGYKIDLKTMQDKHYRELGGVLKNVLEGIRLAHDMGLWVEIVTLVVPGFNDSTKELMDAARYIASVSHDIPWHITAFHPDYKMTDPPATSVATLIKAAEIGEEAGLNFVYAGNIPGRVGEYENTYCPNCKHLLIRRSGYVIQSYAITAEGTCPQCGTRTPGIWAQDSQSVRLGGPGVPRLVNR